MHEMFDRIALRVRVIVKWKIKIFVEYLFKLGTGKTSLIDEFKFQDSLVRYNLQAYGETLLFIGQKETSH